MAGPERGLLWREAGPPNHHDDHVDSDKEVVNKEVPLSCRSWLDQNVGYFQEFDFDYEAAQVRANIRQSRPDIRQSRHI